MIHFLARAGIVATHICIVFAFLLAATFMAGFMGVFGVVIACIGCVICCTMWFMVASLYKMAALSHEKHMDK